MKTAYKAAAVAGVVSLTGCEFGRPAEAPSRIVERIERAGAGSVRAASTMALEQWFATRGPLAREVKQMCASRQFVSGDTEARVCASASVSAFFGEPEAHNEPPVLWNSSGRVVVKDTGRSR